MLLLKMKKQQKRFDNSDYFNGHNGEN